MKKYPNLTGGRLVALTLMLAFGLAATGHAQSTMVRVQISGSSKQPNQKLTADQTSTGARVYPATWAGEMMDRIIDLQLPATSEWQSGSATFTASEDGNVVITLLGPYIRVNEETRELRPVLVEYDDVRVVNAVIKNGSFEKTVADSGLPAYWNLREIDGNPPNTADNRARIVSAEAADGTNAVRVWHNSRFQQIVFVEKDVPVTLTFSYRLAE